MKYLIGTAVIGLLIHARFGWVGLLVTVVVIVLALVLIAQAVGTPEEQEEALADEPEDPSEPGDGFEPVADVYTTMEGDVSQAPQVASVTEVLPWDESETDEIRRKTRLPVWEPAKPTPVVEPVILPRPEHAPLCKDFVRAAQRISRARGAVGLASDYDVTRTDRAFQGAANIARKAVEARNAAIYRAKGTMSEATIDEDISRAIAHTGVSLNEILHAAHQTDLNRI